VQIDDLRPTFFRFADARAFSGWKTANGDYWTTEETLQQAAQVLIGMDCRALACELLLSKPNELGLCLVKHAEPAFEYPERLVFTADVDLHPLDFIEAGERCVCVRRDRTSGTVELFMEQYHKHLDADSNCILIEPHTCDGFLGAIKFMPTVRPGVYQEKVTVEVA